MKRALLLLVMVCLLIAAPLSAAAYEPINVIALDDTCHAIKTQVKEEVTSISAVENVALPAVPIPAGKVLPINNSLICLYVDNGKMKNLWRSDRVSSGFLPGLLNPDYRREGIYSRIYGGDCLITCCMESGLDG